jgi:ferredoxin
MEASAMTFVITQPCIDTMDKSCVEVCPVDCIHFDEGADRMLYISPIECIDCGACQPACPVSAIFPEDDVPADQAFFTEINSLWFEDAAAARAKVPGDGGAPAGAPAAEAAAAPAEAAAPSGAAEAAAAAPVVGAPVAETLAEEPAEVVAGAAQVAPPAPRSAAASALPSPRGLVAVVAFAAVFYAMWVFPGPIWLTIADVKIGATVVLALPIALIFALGILLNEATQLARFSASHERRLSSWREAPVLWRRAEESRRYELVQLVQEIAAERFPYPSAEAPKYRTHVNLPEPQLGLTVAGRGVGALYPDILVVEYPGNHPAMVVQIESKETVTREQAERVWAPLETTDAPLFVYVPAGQLARAKDYARAAGIGSVRFRTWRRQPHGVLVEEF